MCQFPRCTNGSLVTCSIFSHLYLSHMYVSTHYSSHMQYISHYIYSPHTVSVRHAFVGLAVQYIYSHHIVSVRHAFVGLAVQYIYSHHTVYCFSQTCICWIGSTVHMSNAKGND